MGLGTFWRESWKCLKLKRDLIIPFCHPCSRCGRYFHLTKHFYSTNVHIHGFQSRVLWAWNLNLCLENIFNARIYSSFNPLPIFVLLWLSYTLKLPTWIVALRISRSSFAVPFHVLLACYRTSHVWCSYAGKVSIIKTELNRKCTSVGFLRCKWNFDFTECIRSVTD